MITKCPECSLQVSTKAIVCPHCGNPLGKSGNQIRIKPTKRAHRKLPNGFGSITEIKGRYLRKPFFCRVCVGKNENGRPILKSLKPTAYFETYNEAYEALVEYNKNPYSLDDSTTVKALYKRWSKERYPKMANGSPKQFKNAWAYCSEIYNMPVRDVRPRHIKGVMENGKVYMTSGKNKGTYIKASAITKTKIKSLFNLMLDYALEYELVNINYARSFQLSSDVTDEAHSVKKSHITFKPDEIDALWKNINIPCANIILLQCYTGFRPQELCNLLVANVDLENMTLRGGMKTKAGTNRLVPIHPKIRPIVSNLLSIAKECNSEFLVTEKGHPLTYDKYRYLFKKTLAKLNLNECHRCHDPRKTFVTMGKNAGMDEYAIKLIVGHSIRDITESIYTERSDKWLMEQITLIE